MEDAPLDEVLDRIAAASLFEADCGALITLEPREVLRLVDEVRRLRTLATKTAMWAPGMPCPDCGTLDFPHVHGCLLITLFPGEPLLSPEVMEFRQLQAARSEVRRLRAWPPTFPDGTLAFCEDCMAYTTLHARAHSDEEDGVQFDLLTILCDGCHKVIRTFARRAALTPRPTMGKIWIRASGERVLVHPLHCRCGAPECPRTKLAFDRPVVNLPKPR